MNSQFHEYKWKNSVWIVFVSSSPPDTIITFYSNVSPIFGRPCKLYATGTIQQVNEFAFEQKSPLRRPAVLPTCSVYNFRWSSLNEMFDICVFVLVLLFAKILLLVCKLQPINPQKRYSLRCNFFNLIFR